MVRWRSWVAALLVMIGMAPAAYAAGAVTGRVRTDQTVYLQNGKMTVVHEIENNSDQVVTYLDVTKRTFTYKLFSVPYQPQYTRQGTLAETGAQYIVSGQTDSFAAGVVSLKDLPPGLYRLFVFAPNFKGQTGSVSAGTAFRIAPTGEAGTISP